MALDALALFNIYFDLISCFVTREDERRVKYSGGPIGDVLTQTTSRHMGNEFDELFNDQVVKLGLKQEMYQRYADDIESALRSIGRRMMFCPLDGCMVNKPEDQVEREADVEEDELTLRELERIADNLMQNIETEYDCPSSHPELGNKVPVLDLAMWVENVKVSATGMESQEMHSNCDTSKVCLPLGESQQHGLEGEHTVATRMVQQVQFEFYSKPMAPKNGSSWSPLPSPGLKREQPLPQNLSGAS